MLKPEVENLVSKKRRMCWGGGELVEPEYCLYLTAVFSSLFDLYADVWDNYRDDPNVLIVWYEDLKQVRLFPLPVQ